MRQPPSRQGPISNPDSLPCRSSDHKREITELGNDLSTQVYHSLISNRTVLGDTVIPCTAAGKYACTLLNPALSERVTVSAAVTLFRTGRTVRRGGPGSITACLPRCLCANWMLLVDLNVPVPRQASNSLSGLLLWAVCQLGYGCSSRPKLPDLTHIQFTVAETHGFMQQSHQARSGSSAACSMCTCHIS